MAMASGVSTFSNMRVRSRMILGFSAVLFLIVLLTAIGVWRVGVVRGISGGFKATMITLCTLAVLLGIVIATLITRGLLKTLGAEPGEVRALAEAIGRGELDVSRWAYGEHDRSIMAALSRTTDRLQETVANVRHTAHEVSHASGRIEQGNSQLSSRTEQQASALEQTAAAMEELSATVRQNADNARDAEQLATSAASVAERGGEVFGNVVVTMKEINDGARRISEIINVIDNIAFQTNILALNASVEAARAGEQGRGFAVVAGEVRSLASRSAEAAREINALISASVTRTEEGTALVDQAGQTIEEVVTSIKRVHHIMGDISRASAEQSTGVSQVGEAIGQLDQTTQHNAHMVEQNGEASRRLHQQSQALVKAVSVFRLAHSTTGSAAAAVPARAFEAPAHSMPTPASKNVKRPDTSKGSLSRPEAPRAPSRTATVDEWESF
ncbi:methyl-accepting chemotaxis protein [Kushneria indalinina]|uniref:Methyl-accepting chemotaxis protein n=1 Tax=Kushneria indalinina DSM 14324 TaxID=1122140 RepID=A0A3D9DYA8_9GAMM|nr:methyl-accepting chemotaxis protein [Kushneria indalinina]REC95339.1 methyl-accepting chemotaxis protein [Kushneria indalinina DSM 14324]